MNLLNGQKWESYKRKSKICTFSIGVRVVDSDSVWKKNSEIFQYVLCGQKVCDCWSKHSKWWRPRNTLTLWGKKKTKQNAFQNWNQNFIVLPAKSGLHGSYWDSTGAILIYSSKLIAAFRYHFNGNDLALRCNKLELNGRQSFHSPASSTVIYLFNIIASPSHRHKYSAIYLFCFQYETHTHTPKGIFRCCGRRDLSGALFAVQFFHWPHFSINLHIQLIWMSHFLGSFNFFFNDSTSTFPLTKVSSRSGLTSTIQFR